MSTRLRRHAFTISALMVPMVLPVIPVHARHGNQPGAADAPLPIVLRVPALLDSIDIVAGQRVHLRDARVLEVVEAGAILVEANTHYRTLAGQRDRVLVFVADGNLAQFAIGAPVAVEGIARTLLSIRATNEVRWPAELEPDDVKELEVRGAVVGARIVTAEGTPIS